MDAKFLSIALATLALCGCTSSLQRGIREYERARYPEALMALKHAQHDAACQSTASRARFALYNGLTLLAAGRARSAARWLSTARELSRLNPGVLTQADRGRLAAAWQSMGLLPGQSSPSSSRQGLAQTRQR